MVIELAERLISLMPVPMSKVFFNNSGSEANDSAAKLVWYYNNAIGRPRKKKIIGRMKGYHGVTIGAGSLCGLPYNASAISTCRSQCPPHRLPALLALRQTRRDRGRFCDPHGGQPQLADPARRPRYRRRIHRRAGEGAGGVVIPPRTYFAKVQEVLSSYDVLFIADEVICGFGRTGNMFGCETFGIEPDILTWPRRCRRPICRSPPP